MDLNELLQGSENHPSLIKTDFLIFLFQSWSKLCAQENIHQSCREQESLEESFFLPQAIAFKEFILKFFKTKGFHGKNKQI